MIISSLRGDTFAALEQLDTALPGLDWVKITDRALGPITLSKHEAELRPVSLRRVKAEAARRWGTLMLAIYDYGTNTGIRAVATGGDNASARLSGRSASPRPSS